jgi:predicted GIY-YIG superfamily endonuclease
LKYCTVRDESRRISVIDYTISCSVGEDFKKRYGRHLKKNGNGYTKKRPPVNDTRRNWIDEGKEIYVEGKP